MVRFSWRRFSLIPALAALVLVAAPRFAAAEDEEPIYLSPDNPDVVALIKVSEILKSPGFKQAAEANPDLAKKLDEPIGKKTKLTPRDLKTIYVFGDTATKEFVAVITMSKEIDQDELTAGEDVKTEEIGDYELLVKAGQDQAMCLVDDYTLAAGPAATLRKVLKRDDDAEISDELEAAWEDVDDTQHIYVVATLGNLMKMAGATLPPNFPVTADQLQKLTAATLTAGATKGGVKIAADVNCSETALAAQLKALIDAILAQQAAAAPPPVQAVLGTVKTAVDEEILSLSLNVDPALIADQVKAQLPKTE
jgi:hypothetical protein